MNYAKKCMRGIWPSDFTRVVMIPLQKLMNAVECSDHQTISLISHDDVDDEFSALRQVHDGIVISDVPS